METDKPRLPGTVDLRLGLAYGYGSLDRFELAGGELAGGKTHFFQTRLQMLL